MWRMAGGAPLPLAIAPSTLSKPGDVARSAIIIIMAERGDTPNESRRTAFDVSPTGSKAEACEMLNARVYSGRAGPPAGASEWLEDDAAGAAARGADGSLPTVSMGAPSRASSAPIFHWDAGVLTKSGPLPPTAPPPPWLLLLLGEGRYTLRSVSYRLPAMPNRPPAAAGAAGAEGAGAGAGA